jgi:hypothetical protein
VPIDFILSVNREIPADNPSIIVPVGVPSSFDDSVLEVHRVRRAVGSWSLPGVDATAHPQELVTSASANDPKVVNDAVATLDIQVLAACARDDEVNIPNFPAIDRTGD